MQNRQSQSQQSRLWRWTSTFIISAGLVGCGTSLNDVAVAPTANANSSSAIASNDATDDNNTNSISLLYENNPSLTTIGDAAIALAILNGLDGQSDAPALAAGANQLLGVGGPAGSINPVPTATSIDFVAPRGPVDLTEIAVITSATRFPCPNPPSPFLAEAASFLLGTPGAIAPDAVRPIPGGPTPETDNPPKLPTGADDSISSCPLTLPIVPRESFDRTFERAVGPDDVSDSYQISLVLPARLVVNVSGIAGAVLTDSVALRVVRDANRDGEIDPEEILATSDRPGVEPEFLDIGLASGEYFVQVLYPGESGQVANGTGYSLRAQVEP